MPYSNYEDKLEYNRAWKRVNSRRKRGEASLGPVDVFWERLQTAAAEAEASRRELRRDRRERG